MSAFAPLVRAKRTSTSDRRTLVDLHALARHESATSGCPAAPASGSRSSPPAREVCPRWCRVTRVRKSNQQTQCPDFLTSGRQDDGLAGRLRVEEPVGFLGLLEPPAVREEPLHLHLPLGDELGALGLALLRERPRPHQRDLPAQEIRADVERDLTAHADETGGAPRAYGAHGRGTGVRRRGGVERLVRALAV